MNGSNQLILCQAELMVALQEYLDKRMGNYAPAVVGVCENKAEYNFVVDLVEKPKEGAA